MRNFNKLANLHNMFFKRAEGALPKQFQGLEGFPLPGRPKMGPGHPLYRPAPGPGGALKGMPSPSKPPEALPTKSSVTPGPNDVDPRYTPGMSAHGKYMDDIASMTPEGREHKLRHTLPKFDGKQPPQRSAYSILSNPTAADRMRDAPNPLSSEFRTGPQEGGRWSNAQKAILDPAGQHPFNLSHNMPTAHPGPGTVRNVQMARPGE